MGYYLRQHRILCTRRHQLSRVRFLKCQLYSPKAHHRLPGHGGKQALLPSPHSSARQQRLLLHAPHRSQDQSLIIRCVLFLLDIVSEYSSSGGTGSGKSESRRLATKMFLELFVSNPGKKSAKLVSQVPAAKFVIESFGEAWTLFNPNASRFEKYTELQTVVWYRVA